MTPKATIPLTTEPTPDVQPAPAGVVLVDKPMDWTSHDVVARIRRLAATRKVGHAGTLDPLATGLLVLGVNRATRLMGYLSGTDKEYEADILLGVSTHSDDSQGDETARTDASAINRHDIDTAVQRFIGTIDQVPSSVSAIKVDGQRAHARVRAGEDVVLAARSVTITSFDVLDFTPGTEATVTIRVACSSGTYVRALARDLGATLGVGGHVTRLRRTRVGGFLLEDAHTLEALDEEFHVVPMSVVARSTFPSVDLNTEEANDVRFGRPLPERRFENKEPHAVFDPAGEFLALYANKGKGIAPVAVFV